MNPIKSLIFLSLASMPLCAMQNNTAMQVSTSASTHTLLRSRSLPNLHTHENTPVVVPPAPPMPKQVARPKFGPAPEQPQPSFFQRHPIAMVSSIGACAIFAAGVVWKLAQTKGIHERRLDG